MSGLPDPFVKTMVEMYGEAGEKWLHRLPDLLAECARRWSLTLQAPFPNLTYNYVTPAVRADGTPVVLKVGYPNRELISEIEALRIYDGRGIVQLLESDRALGALVLERLEPGTPLAQLDHDEKATEIAAQVMRALHRPVPAGNSFRPVADWTAGLSKLRPRFGGTTGPFPAHLVDTAERLFAELIPSMAAPVLLHGDLHHDNILAATREPWLALDPKGIIGEPAFEVGTFLHNPMPQIATWPNLDRILARRVDQFAEELNAERQRILAWGIAQAVLSAWWSVEDQGHGWEPALAVAEVLASL